jgi:xylulokinase
MFLGLDLGTSGLKAILVDEEGSIIAAKTCALTVQRPAPGWSEQTPANWWAALLDAVDSLKADYPKELAAVRAIGLSGQMHGAVLLDAADQILRPCILWNDTRAERECRDLERQFPELRLITGNAAMPGFTAPKLMWVSRNEPEVFRRIARVLLPKAWLRLCLSGESFEDMSDASGTLWLDVGARCWSQQMLAATGLAKSMMPTLVEGNAPAGRLRPTLVARWGMTVVPLIAGGAGDNAAGAIGLGAVAPGSSFVSLGTSGVLWSTTERFRPYPDRGVHSFCHALPHLWHQMGVTLSAAASLSWWASITGHSESALIEELANEPVLPGKVVFLPYLAGERTPHNNGDLRGSFANLSADNSRAEMTKAILEGVAFSIRDCLDALTASGTSVLEADVIGGGSRSRIWVAILASVLGIPLHRIEEGEHGAALGAARLARLALTGEHPSAVCHAPARVETILPGEAARDLYADSIVTFRRLYPSALASKRKESRTAEIDRNSAGIYAGHAPTPGRHSPQ